MAKDTGDETTEPESQYVPVSRVPITDVREWERVRAEHRRADVPLDCLLGWEATPDAPPCSSLAMHLCKHADGHGGDCACSCGATSGAARRVFTELTGDGLMAIEYVGLGRWARV